MRIFFKNISLLFTLSVCPFLRRVLCLSATVKTAPLWLPAVSSGPETAKRSLLSCVVTPNPSSKPQKASKSDVSNIFTPRSKYISKTLACRRLTTCGTTSTTSPPTTRVMQTSRFSGEMYKVADYLPLPTTAASDLAISTDKQSSVVPLTVKPWRKDTQGLETSLAVVFGDDNYQRLKSELFLSKVPETVELLDAKQVKYDGPIFSHFKQYPESGLVKHQAYCNTFYVSLAYYYRQSTWLTMVITVFGQRLCRTDQISQTPGPRRPLENGCWFERHCQYNLRLRFCRKSATRGENHQQLCRNVSVNVNLNQ